MIYSFKFVQTVIESCLKKYTQKVQMSPTVDWYNISESLRLDNGKYDEQNKLPEINVYVARKIRHMAFIF